MIGGVEVHHGVSMPCDLGWFSSLATEIGRTVLDSRLPWYTFLRSLCEALRSKTHPPETGRHHDMRERTRTHTHTSP